MSTQYLLPMAENTTTGVRIKQQDLTGYRYTLRERSRATEVATQLCNKLIRRTGDTNWVPVVETYTPTSVDNPAKVTKDDFKRILRTR